MSPELKYKITACASLLAASPLDEEIKNTILENVGGMTESDIDKIISALERETFELSSLSEVLTKFDADQVQNWESLEAKQKEAADALIDETFEKITTNSISAE